MKCKKCGGEKFFAEQEVVSTITFRVIVDSDGNLLENIKAGREAALDDAEFSVPYGPFSCTSCSAEWKEDE
jgi:hypothetical protein